MNEQTLVAVYDTAAHADAAVRDLKADHVPANAISQHAKNGGASHAGAAAPVEAKGFWGKLFGGEPDHDTAVYDRSIESGSTVVTVRVQHDHFDKVSAILEKHHPVDLDERAAGYDSATTATRTTAPLAGARETVAANGGDKLQLSEETLAVGKRAVSGGTTRIRRYVVETPVQEQVSLHSEKVTLDRHPVTDGRTVGNGDFTDKTIEMTETSEEAVVSKTARVKEEVSLHKDVSDRVETVKDTVRREDVKIEHVPGVQTATSARPGITAPVTAPTPPRQGAKV